MTTKKILKEELKVRLLVGYGSVSKIEHYQEKGNFLQILYTYGIEALQILLEYNVFVENYEACVKIRDVVKNNNKATGTNYILK